MMIPKYLNEGVLGWFGNVKNKVMGAFNKPSVPSAIELKYINMTPPVKYNPRTPNVPGPVNFPKFSFKNLIGGLTSINTAPYILLGMSQTTLDSMRPLSDGSYWVMDWDTGKPTLKEISGKPQELLKPVNPNQHKRSSGFNTNNLFQWDNKYWANIGSTQKGLDYNNYMKAFNNWYDLQKFNLSPQNRAYIAKQNWDMYVKKGYNKIDNSNVSTPVTTTSSTAAPVTTTAPVNEWETKYNDLNTRYLELQKQIEELRKPITPQEVSPTPTPTLVETPQLILNKIRLANTEAFLNNSRNPGWRRRYREGLNTALRNGDLYNVYTGQGNQSFDMAGLSMGDLLSTLEGLRYFDPVKGFTRGGIRRLAKDYRKGRIGTSIGLALSNFIGQSSNGSHALTNIAPPVDTGEPDVQKKVVV